MSREPTNPPAALLTPANAWRMARADSVSVIVDAASYFEAFRVAVLAARQRVVIVGWDIDGRTSLSPDGAESGDKTPLLAFLAEALERNEALEVHVLAWDFSPIYWFEREDNTADKFRRAHPRIHFHFDSVHPAGASHHQKFVVIDDVLAFVGGIDLTIRRWDTTQHADDSAERVDHEGKPYAPMHDVQMCVAGPAAGALGALAAERFARAGAALPKSRHELSAATWPSSLSVDFRDVALTITRTRSPALPGDEDVRESERTTLQVVEAARQSVYIENQYLTSGTVAGAIARRLSEPDGPEFVIVLPREECGWLERRLMGELRRRSLSALRAADVHGHLRLLYPVIHEPDVAVLNVHSKLMIVDQRLLKVGSSNLSNRSMGLDSECDVWMENPIEQCDGVRAVLARLLAEHTGEDADAIVERLVAGASLRELVDGLGRPDRRLRDIAHSQQAPDLTPLSVSLFDPERPEMPEAVLDVVLPLKPHAPRRRVVLSLIFTLGGLALVAAAAYAAHDHASALITRLRDTAATPAGFFGAVGFFGLAALAFVPITLLVTSVALVFEPIRALPVMFLGGMLAAMMGHTIGRAFSGGVTRLLGSGRLERMRRRVTRHGLWSTVVARALPIGNFTLVNLVAGAVGVPFLMFVLGSAIGMLPGMIAMTFIVRQLGAATTKHSLSAWLAAGLSILAFVALSLVIARAVRNRQVVRAMAAGVRK